MHVLYSSPHRPAAHHMHHLRPALQGARLARQLASPSCAASPSTTTTRAPFRKTHFDRAAFKHALQAAELGTCLKQAEALVCEDDGQPSAQGRLHVYNQLQGLHQQLFRKLLHSKDLQGIQRYLSLLPPKPRLFTSLMKECTIQGNQDALNAVLQVVPLCTADCPCACITRYILMMETHKHVHLHSHTHLYAQHMYTPHTHTPIQQHTHNPCTHAHTTHHTGS